MQLLPGSTWKSIGPELASVCERYGHDFAALATHANYLQRRVVGKPDWKMYAKSKAGECIFALHCGLDPHEVVRLNTERGDDSDVLAFGKHYEIKDTQIGYEYLFWSLNRRDYLYSKHYDRIVLVKSRLEFEHGSEHITDVHGFCHGWLSKREFLDKHQIAPAGHPHLREGTPFVPEAELHHMSELVLTRGFVGFHRGHFEHYCHCGKEAGFGYGVSLLRDQLGTWYCREHCPQEPQNMPENIPAPPAPPQAQAPRADKHGQLSLL